MTARYNVVFVGKTGVGKSALINYLYGDKIRETGVGKPVTQRRFQCVDFEINGLPVRLFDSCGLEVGEEGEQEWVGDLDEELKKRGTGKPAEEWFHSVFYCIAGSGHRVEKFEIEVIKRFIKEKYKVVVILTKADLISEEDEEKLRNTVQNDLGQEVLVIPVCSEEKQLRGGIISEKFGKEEVELQAYNDFWDSIILRLPDRCEKVVIEYIDSEFPLHNDKLAKLKSIYNINYDKLVKLNNLLKSLKKEDNSISNLVISEIKNSIEMYGNFAKALNYRPNTMEGIKNINLEDFFDSCFVIEGILSSGIGLALTILTVNPIPAFLGSVVAGVKIYKRNKEVDMAAEDFKREIKKEIKPLVEQLLREVQDGKAA